VKSAECRYLDFWRMLEFFYGVESTNNLFGMISRDTNHPTNLITLDNSIHAMFDNSSLLLLPISNEDEDIEVMGNYPISYQLRIVYPKGKVREPRLIQSVRLLREQEEVRGVSSRVEGGDKEEEEVDVRPVFSGSWVQIEYQNPASTIHPLPSPVYFALRKFVLFLQFTCRQQRRGE